MTEAEIVYQLSEAANRSWSLLQWWVSISFGLLVVAHVASEKLNAFLLLMVITLYVSFSLLVGNIWRRYAGTVAAYKEDLQALVESGAEVARGTNYWIHHEGIKLLAAFVLVFTFICVIAYLLYCYRESRRE